MDAATAFTSISLLSTVTFTLNSVSEMVSDILNISVTVSRFNGFLSEPEFDKFNESADLANSDKDTWIGFENAEFGYFGSESQKNENDDSEETTAFINTESSAFRLRDISIEFPKNSLSVIVGMTGSGKTSLLMTLLGGI